jgi:hypothetical protein
MIRSGWLVALAATALIIPSSGAGADTLIDKYLGGVNTYNGGDVIGPDIFDVTSLDATRINGGNTLKIVINTQYAGVPGTPAADGTIYGSLFFAPVWNPVGTGLYPNDVYSPSAGTQWTSAFVTNTATCAAGSTCTGALYSVGSSPTPNAYPQNPGVVQSYTTTTGTIVLSNVNNDPVTYPGPQNPGYYFRQGQPVLFQPSASKIDGSTWFITPGTSITYLINDNHLLGDSFAVSWDMTCANDVIQGVVAVPGPIVGAGLPGLILACGGMLGWMRRRKAITA